jgi:tetratricopeptide (TPR) repeat protein
VRRADMYSRIAKLDDAIKDYKEALTVGKDDPTLQPNTYEKLAYAYVQKGRLKEAAETLNKAPISLARLRELADDPRFKPLRESKYAKLAFGLKEE